MPIRLQQIFYGHNGQKYEIFAHSSNLPDDVIDEAVKSVNGRINRITENEKDPDQLLYGDCNNGKYHYWFLKSPGEKDVSGRPTYFLHIFLCGSSDVTAEGKINCLHFYRKLPREYPDKVIEDLNIPDEEFKPSPPSTAPEDGGHTPNKKSSVWRKVIAAVIGLIIISISLGAGYVLGGERKGKEDDKKINENNTLHDSQLKEIGNRLGLSKDGSSPSAIMEEIKKLKDKNQELTNKLEDEKSKLKDEKTTLDEKTDSHSRAEKEK